ncbi:hypothetical protein LVJ83_02760 [Uruburuella testudinis]|uniref:Uncharacterized protein n=1 Tax=Uruburuella testudinis TaxID=1282863 RepID=A0ABY4DTP6_9NEIS|nr:hypothetical protein [Uruburuella testudinis]UOO82414.1 hypothetical protein LVJ83_02760 [Uruburuella testudinis]
MLLQSAPSLPWESGRGRQTVGLRAAAGFSDGLKQQKAHRCHTHDALDDSAHHAVFFQTAFIHKAV